LQSPVHHLKSYSLSDHARWAAIIPGLLCTWLTEGRMQSHFFHAAKKHTQIRDEVLLLYHAVLQLQRGPNASVTAEERRLAVPE
jgi:hypothetical protein